MRKPPAGDIIYVMCSKFRVPTGFLMLFEAERLLGAKLLEIPDSEMQDLLQKIIQEKFQHLTGEEVNALFTEQLDHLKKLREEARERKGGSK